MRCSKRGRGFQGAGDIIIAIPGPRAHFNGLVGRYKCDGVVETLNLHTFTPNPSFNNKTSSSQEAKVQEFVSQMIPFFAGEGNSAVIALLCSIILTRGFSNIRGRLNILH